MGFWSGLCDIVSSACSFVSNAIGAIGRGIASLATGILKVGGGFLGGIGIIAKAIGIGLGFLKPKDNLNELGYKAMMSEKSCEDFDSTEAYINHLREDVRIDQEKLKNQTKEEKMANKAVGVAITTRGIKEKTGVDVSPEFWAEAGRHSFSPDLTFDLIQLSKEENNLSDISDYLKNKPMDIEEKLATGEKLRTAMAKQKPDLNVGEIDAQVQDMCAASRK